MPITIKKKTTITIGNNSFIGNRIVGKKEVDKLKKETQKVTVTTKTKMQRYSK